MVPFRMLIVMYCEWFRICSLFAYKKSILKRWDVLLSALYILLCTMCITVHATHALDILVAGILGRASELVPSSLGPDSRWVIILRNGVVRMKQNLSTAHKFVVSSFQNIYEFCGHYLASIFVAFCRFHRCCENQTNLAEGQLFMSKNQSEIVWQCLCLHIVICSIHEYTHQRLPQPCRHVAVETLTKLWWLKNICNSFWGKRWEVT